MITEHIASLIVLALLGIIDSGYLIWKRKKQQPLACPIGGHDCNVVVESKWSSTFGVKNDILGLTFYICLIIGAFILGYTSFSLVKWLIFLASLGALGFSTYLVYVQSRILKKYCFYCLLSALINLLVFLNAILLL